MSGQGNQNRAIEMLREAGAHGLRKADWFRARLPSVGTPTATLNALARSGLAVRRVETGPRGGSETVWYAREFAPPDAGETLGAELTAARLENARLTARLAAQDKVMLAAFMLLVDEKVYTDEAARASRLADLRTAYLAYNDNRNGDAQPIDARAGEAPADTGVADLTGSPASAHNVQE